jgi:hypothetical protein
VTIEQKTIDLTLRIWRQAGPDGPGAFKTYRLGPISTDISFLEMLDILNERLSLAGEEPVAFDHDCREGICGTCGAVVTGIPHGPVAGPPLCQLHMRHFQDGDTLVLEPAPGRGFGHLPATRRSGIVAEHHLAWRSVPAKPHRPHAGSPLTSPSGLVALAQPRRRS